jgi:hypothetical protein
MRPTSASSPDPEHPHLSSLYATRLPYIYGLIVGCTALSERIPELGPSGRLKIQGDAWDARSRRLVWWVDHLEGDGSVTGRFL